MDKRSIVLVEWVDASYQTEVVGAADLPDPMITITSGFLVRDEEDYVTVALTLYDDGDARLAMAIPRVCISRLVVLHKGKK